MATLLPVGFFILRSESLRLVDQQIEEMVSTLYASQLSFREIEGMEEAHDVVSMALGDERLNAVISLYTASGTPIYQSHYAAVAGLKLRLPSGRELLETNRGHVIRLLTVPVARGKQYLQVGIVLDSNLMRWRMLGLRLAGYLALTFIVLAVISYSLSHLLLQPLEAVARYLQYRVDHFDTPSTLSQAWPIAGAGSGGRRDELGRLLQSVQALLDKVKETVDLNRSRSSLLAHEIRTPLTIVKNRLETMQKASPEQFPTLTEDALSEVDRLGRVTSAFLQWSFFCSSPGLTDDIHALRLSEVVGDIIRKLETVYPGRLRLEADGEEVVFAHPEHLSTSLSNLIVNALKYSPVDAEVTVVVGGAVVSVRDSGAGFPQHVLDSLGSPFNVGEARYGERGTGLGLAWVVAIARKYGWRFRVSRLSEHTQVELDFSSATEVA